MHKWFVSEMLMSLGAENNIYIYRDELNLHEKINLVHFQFI